jgi:coenzyme F420-reducing hydrogenase beta subunit
MIRAAHRAYENRASARLADISIGEVWSLLTSTLIMETELVSEMFVFDLALTQLYTQDNFITETLSV